MATDSDDILCVHKQSLKGKHLNSKRLVICCDGTWNNANAMGEKAPTNVSRLSSAVAHKCCTGKPQIVYYHPGAGTETSKVARFLGGAFGMGVEQHIIETYHFICDNYNPGDEVILLGFSRGAFTARSVADMICSLGYLNRAGLAKLPYIFHDYETWQDWPREKEFDENEHLQAFTLANQDEIRRYELKRQRADGPLREGEEVDVKKTLLESKKQLWGDMKKKHWHEVEVAIKDREGKPTGEKKKVMYADRRGMAASYRQMLKDHWMLHGEKIQDGEGEITGFEPAEGKVKAVAVWDTVGSLGLPKLPWKKLTGARSDDEVRFASIEIDPNVENAFHALALDEMRSAFGATMWETTRPVPIEGIPQPQVENQMTRLRQVWFPGNHGNCGGGWIDAQAATISLAWMADQLTSIGVEFDKNEMQRIFFSLNQGAVASKWAMGDLRSSTSITSVPDRLYNFFATPIRMLRGTTDTGRYPGMYKTESVVFDGYSDRLYNANEMVHPSARIRYWYNGRGLNDDGLWGCPSLVGNGYKLERRGVPNETRPARVKGINTPYTTVTGSAVPYFGVRDGSIERKGLAPGDHPKVVRTEQPLEAELERLPPPREHWVWKRVDSKTGEEIVLEEEQIGVWERMFILINNKVMGWQEYENAEKEKPKLSFFGKIAKGVTGVVSKIGSVFNKSKKEELRALAPDGYQEYGYHDILVWQKGDSA